MTDRSIFARVKAGPGPWVRFTGTETSVTVAGFDPETEIEWDDGTGLIREFETLAATAPEAFGVDDWSVSANGTVTIENMPADGGSSITDIEYRIDTGSGFGAAVSFGEEGPGSYATTAEEADDIQIRAVNAVGDGDWSDTKAVPPASAVLLEDDFSERTETTLLGSDPDWTVVKYFAAEVDGVSLIHTDKWIRRDGSGEGGFYRYDPSVSVLPADQFAEIDIAQSTAPTVSNTGVLARYVDASNYYEARAVRFQASTEVNEIRLIRVVSGTETVLETASWSYSVPVALRIEAVGTSLRVLLGGTQVIAPVTDSSHSAGSAGLSLRRSGSSSGSVRISAFRCGGL